MCTGFSLASVSRSMAGGTPPYKNPEARRGASNQTLKFIGPLMPIAMGVLSAKNGHIRRAPLVGAEAVWSIQDDSGADEQRPPRKAAKRDSREARTSC